MCKFLEFTDKGSGARTLVLPRFLVVDLDLMFNVIYLKIKLKVLVGCFFCYLIVGLTYNANGNTEIIIVAALSNSHCALGTVELKLPWRYLYFLNCATFSKGVECVLGFM